MHFNKKPIHGFGINDVTYTVSKFEYTEGFTKSGSRKKTRVWECPYYGKWRRMLNRALSKTNHKTHPTYIDCTVSEEFRHLSDFIKWIDSQPDRDWENKQVDKDFLVEGNKHYSPETCVLLGGKVNTFMHEGSVKHSGLLIGVRDSGSKLNPFRANCSDPFGIRKRHIGMYKTEMEAHIAWKVRKHQYACELAELEPDERIKKILVTTYK